MSNIKLKNLKNQHHWHQVDKTLSPFNTLPIPTIHFPNSHPSIIIQFSFWFSKYSLSKQFLYKNLILSFVAPYKLYLTRSRVCVSPRPVHHPPRILPMTQHSDNIWNERKFLPLFTDRRRYWKRWPSTRKYLSQSQLIVSLKIHTYNNPSCTYSTPDTNLHWLASAFVLLFLHLDSDTPVSWERRFSDFLGVCLGLVPMASNFSSVRTRRVCFFFFFLSIKSLVVLSLFTKLWIVCLLGTLSSRNLRRNFRRHFQCHTEIHATLKYSEPCHTTLLTAKWEQMAHSPDNYCLLLGDNS
jgi:hypothetical protein